MLYKLDKKFLSDIRKRTTIILLLCVLIALALTVFVLSQSNVKTPIIIFSMAFSGIIGGFVLYFTLYRKKPIEKLDWLVKVENGLVTVNNNDSPISFDITSITGIEVLKDLHGNILRIRTKGQHPQTFTRFIENLSLLLAEISVELDAQKISEKKISLIGNWVSGIFTLIIIGIIYWYQTKSSSAIIRIVFDNIIPFFGGILLLIIPHGQNPFIKKKRKTLLAVLLILMSVGGSIFELNRYFHERKISLGADTVIVFPEIPKSSSKDYDVLTLQTHFSENNDVTCVVDVLSFKQTLSESQASEFMANFLEKFINDKEQTVLADDDTEKGKMLTLMNHDKSYTIIMIERMDNSRIIALRVESDSLENLHSRKVEKFLKYRHAPGPVSIGLPGTANMWVRLWCCPNWVLS